MSERPFPCLILIYHIRLHLEQQLQVIQQQQEVVGHLALLERGVLDLLWPLAFKLLGISLFPSQEFGGLISINFADFEF